MHSIVALVGAVTLLLLTVPLAAQSTRSKDWRDCHSPTSPETNDRNIAACTRIINLPKESRKNKASAYTSRCAEWAEKKNYARAFADCDQAIELDPSDAGMAFNNRGATYERNGDKDRAIADYRKGVALGNTLARDNLRRLGVAP